VFWCGVCVSGVIRLALRHYGAVPCSYCALGCRTVLCDVVKVSYFFVLGLVRLLVRVSFGVRCAYVVRGIHEGKTPNFREGPFIIFFSVLVAAIMFCRWDETWHFNSLRLAESQGYVFKESIFS